MRKKPKKRLPANPKDLTELAKLSGQVRVLEHDGMGVYYPVTIGRVGLVGCNLKAEVTPVNGVGSVEVCLGDLLTLEEANKAIENETIEQEINQELQEVVGLYYCSERRAAFVRLVERLATPEELAKLKEEVNTAGNLRMANDHFIRQNAERLIRQSRELPTKLRDDDEDDDFLDE